MPDNIMPDTFPSLFIGYTVFWFLILLYVVSLRSRVRRLESALAEANNADTSDPIEKRS